MAPIFPLIGITPQIIDDDRLKALKTGLESIRFDDNFNNDSNSSEDSQQPLDIERLIDTIEPWQAWGFEEQVDLQEWVEALNKMDAVLSFYIETYPYLFLVSPVETSKTLKQRTSRPARTIEEAESVPDYVCKRIIVILKFLSGLLANSTNKSVFNSVDQLVDLLAAADDHLAATSLETICALAIPPCLHKQQVPEIQQHTSALHISKTSSHKRLTALARGWGTRGSGLGLYTCAISDDSVFGQGSLPRQAGELDFTFYRSRMSSQTSGSDNNDASTLVHVKLSANSFTEDSEMTVAGTSRNSEESDDSTESKQKRRRVALPSKVEKTIRSTPDLFFECLQQAGGAGNIPDDRLFPLLADIRLTRSFYSQATRVAAIERRLRALITILHANPSQEILAGYFQAQPELCVELVDLLRPTVSSGAVSAASSSQVSTSYLTQNQDSIAALANSPIVPYQVRELALQSLTALAARREGGNGAMAGFARHSNILTELGVGKGQYLGLLPTLIRYSLASLGSLVSPTLSSDKIEIEDSTVSAEATEEETISMDIGLAFIEATSAPSMPRFQQLEKALLFIDSVLTLTSAIVSTPSGTSSLTECGLVPALLNTVSIDTEEVVSKITPETSSLLEVNRIRSLLRFITAQAVQILEGAIVTHSNALSAFHNLKGVEVLTTRLSREVLATREKRGGRNCDVDCTDMAIDNKMELDSFPFGDSWLRASQRVLLFGVVTCLTVVFHQESTSSSVTTPSGTAEIQKPDITNALMEILDNVDLYGGHLASLISTLLSDIMNSDPHVVKYVHESGLARSFLNMLHPDPSGEPIPPPVPELIMSLPAVLAALALTEAGAKKLKEDNPFPGLLKLFHHHKYAMPRSRCLLNEMTSIIGTGLDEIMRHVPSLSEPICNAISGAMKEVVKFGDHLMTKETSLGSTGTQDSVPLNVDHERSCLIQYGLNFGQILEQILHNEEHCEPFLKSGGLDAILDLYPYLMPISDMFLSHISCLSCPSLSTITHSTTEETLTLAFKCIALRCDPLKIIRTTVGATKRTLDTLKAAMIEIRNAFPSKYKNEDDFDATGILHSLPALPICDIVDPAFHSKKDLFAKYLRATVTVQWLSGLLAALVQASCQRDSESGASAWNRSEREWKKELQSSEFIELFHCLSSYCQSATLETCRIRSEEDFDTRELQRQKGDDSNHLRYKLRIVCLEGAVVRDGIEIDSCASVGSMEMGEIVESFDRCVNSSGVLRYRTERGWFSEQTRGHGREPIAEVIAVWKSDSVTTNKMTEPRIKERIENGIPDIRTSGANVLARMQTVYVELYTSLLRLVQQSVSTLSPRSMSFHHDHVSSLMRTISSRIKQGFQRQAIRSRLHTTDEASCVLNKFGTALYLGSLISHLQACLFEEKRDKQIVHFPLLVCLAYQHIIDEPKENTPGTEVGRLSFFDAIEYIYDLGLADFKSTALVATKEYSDKGIPRQRLNRTTASFLPPVTSILRRLIRSASIVPSQTMTSFDKMKESDVLTLVGLQKEAPGNHLDQALKDKKGERNFSSQNFFPKLLCKTSDIIKNVWCDLRLVHAPPQIIHPFSLLVSETIGALEDETKRDTEAPTFTMSRESSAASNTSFLARLRRARGDAERTTEERSNATNNDDNFEPSEEAISRLMEMGFSRDHAWDAIDRTRSNTLEIAMEYALTHPQSSTESIARRRDQMQRRRQLQQPVEESMQRDAAVMDNDESSTGNDDEVGPMEVEKESSEKSKVTDGSREASLTIISSRITAWREDGLNVAGNILCKRKPKVPLSVVGDGEGEALTTVLSSFLLDLCQKYPNEKDAIVMGILTRLKEKLEETRDHEESIWNVIAGNEHNFALLCQSAVILIRALPSTRKLVLKLDLLKPIISVIALHLSRSRSTAESKSYEWPPWLPSAILILDFMAQPFVAFNAKNKTGDTPEFEGSICCGELQEVEKDHEKQTRDLSILTHTLATALKKENPTYDPNSKPRTSSVLSTASPDQSYAAKNTGSSTPQSKTSSLFESVPPYFPLIPSQYVEKCADICLSIIEQGSNPPPGVTHATLLLLMRLLRNPKLSSYCSKKGTAQKILGLDRGCRFHGHSGLVTGIFRRLFEDEVNLPSIMETEIRNVMAKLNGKNQNASSASKDNLMVPRKAFLKAITPILCRDPASFIKAIAVSVVFKNSTSNSDGYVAIMSSAQRAKNLEIMHEVLNLKQSYSQHGKVATGKKKRLSNASVGPRSKTPTRSTKRGHGAKRNKKDKVESKENAPGEDTHKYQQYNMSTIQQITGLLLNQVIQTGVPTRIEVGQSQENYHGGFDFGYESSFLWTANALDILADLVLAMPACATAIHKFKASKKNRGALFSTLSHLLEGSSNPPRTFVTFLLHNILAQRRYDHASSKTDTKNFKERNLEEKLSKKTEVIRTKTVRSAARLLVAMVARPGEGRRRVILELIFALSGGQLGLSSTALSGFVKPLAQVRPSDLRALESWGELCIGFAAPKSNGSTYDSSSILSFEVIKVMLENGMAHALLMAMHRIPINHPRASRVLGHLILPFEILTRGGVSDSVKAIVDRDSRAREERETTKSSQHVASKEKNSDILNRRDSFLVDDHMLEDAFAANIPPRERSASDIDDDIVVDDEHDILVDVEDDDDGTHMDVDNGNDEELSDDEEMSSESESGGSSDEEDSVDDNSEDESDDSDEDTEAIVDDLVDSEGGYSRGEFDDDPFNLETGVNDLVNDDNEFEEVNEGGRERNENQIEEGWTRIDSNGLNGMVLGGRRGIGQHLNGPGAGRGNRDFIDAAEAMIGTLLRTGEIRGEALAEIEGTLGIQIVPSGERNVGVSGRRPIRGGAFGNFSFGGRRESSASRSGSRGTIGALPRINQRTQPDLGYSAMGRGSRWNEINPMEYVYGGPCITAGSRHYDLVTPIPEEDESALLIPQSGQANTQLFPGGPSAVTHARPQHYLHPLLGDVDLPPINALVDNIESHDVRARRVHVPTAARRLGEWNGPTFSSGGFFVSSTSTVVRTNRMMGSASRQSASGNSGALDWTDHDGPLFDEGVEQFRAAIENAIGETMLRDTMTGQVESAEALENYSRNQEEPERPSARNEVSEQISAREEEDHDDVAMEGVTNEGNRADRSDGEPNQDGDGVASSLALGLSLSPTPATSLSEANSASNSDRRENPALENPEETQNMASTRANQEHQGDNDDENTVSRETTDEVLAGNEIDHGGINEQNGASGDNEHPSPNGNGLVCPSGMDPEVFDALPLEMQQEVVMQARETSELANQLDPGSSLDPEVLAALPEEMRREAIEQEQRERRLREQAPADPSNAAEMDNASFVASLAPELRNDILLTAEDTFIQSLPPSIIAEAQILRERARAQAQTNRRLLVQNSSHANQREASNTISSNHVSRSSQATGNTRDQTSTRRKQRSGKIRVEMNRTNIVFLPPKGPSLLKNILGKADLKAMIRFMYLLSPLRPRRILQKVFQNISMNGDLRLIVCSTFLNLLNDKRAGGLEALEATSNLYDIDGDWREKVDQIFESTILDFPPVSLIGAAPDVIETEGVNSNIMMIRRGQSSDTAAYIAANLPISSYGSLQEQCLPPVVSTRMLDTLLQMCKNSQRFCLDLLVKNLISANKEEMMKAPTGFEILLDLLAKPRYSKSSTNLEQLLNLLEYVVSPLSQIPRTGEEIIDVSKKDVDDATSQGKEWVDVPRVVLSQERLQLLCSILRMEICKDTAFSKVNTIARRLCRVDANRGYVLTELASVARALGIDATRDLKALNIRISATIDRNREGQSNGGLAEGGASIGSGASTSVAVSTSTSELKLLRVLQTLQSLCTESPDDSATKRNETVFITGELVQLLEAMNLDNLWSELTSCLNVVQVLEGVSIEEDAEKGSENNNLDDFEGEDAVGGKKKLQNSIAGLLTRFLPSIEAFFVANGCFTRSERDTMTNKGSNSDDYNTNLVGGERLFDFVDSNKVLLNALVRNNSSLLEKGLKTLIQLPRCRMLLDFDVKRHWFKLQVRRLRQQANRRYGSIRLHIRRDYVFEDAYLQLSPRNAEEMRGRLHITFRNEQGVDAGGLSREFYGILAKEIFNPNYALFTSTEDGCTFQPNPHSNVNPDHLSYFRFVGRIVGKAVADGYLLDSHFTRSLYKHMLGKEPTHHDMEAIDPDYYKNLKTVLEYNLGDLCLDLTFSVDDHSFGRKQVIDLLPNGRNIPVTEENKAKYVSLVCKHRMTTAISSQIKAFLDGFHELVSHDLIQIFTPRELELLISGLPDIDIHDLKKNTDYNGWKPTDPQIEWFWSVLFSLSRNEKASFLQFVTGSSKVPLAGFAELPGMRGVQKFSIHKTSGSAGSLMSAHTCFNSLDLPVYKSEEELREKLLYAITEGAVGFLMA